MHLGYESSCVCNNHIISCLLLQILMSLEEVSEAQLLALEERLDSNMVKKTLYKHMIARNIHYDSALYLCQKYSASE